MHRLCGALKGVIVCGAILLSAASLAAQTAAPRAPTGLAATAASKSAVTLTWAPGDATIKFVVERKTLGAAWPAPTATIPAGALSAAAIATVDAATGTDSRIDQFATYVYRARAVGGNNVLSPPSNEVTVGPPPVGFTTVAAAPKAMHDHDAGQFARVMRLLLDANGDPALAFLNFDLNLDGEPPDTDLLYISWNRARYRWNAAVKVDTVGNVSTSGATLPFGIARDDSNGRIAVFYGVESGHELKLATSDDAGQTWKVASVQRTAEDQESFATPSIALAGGNAHVAYHRGNAVRYATGSQSASPDRWQVTDAPKLANTADAMPGGVSLVLDSSGKPGVAYWLGPSEGYTLTLAFWRPGSAPVKVADTAGHQTDDPAISLSAINGQIAIGFYANRDDRFFSDHHLWFTQSADGGASWSPAAVVADDGGDAMGYPFAVTMDRGGRAALVANVSGGNSGTAKCGQPKLARAGTGNAWTTCAPDTRGMASTADVYGPSAVFAGNDKLYVAFKTRGTAAGLPPGLVLWRER